MEDNSSSTSELGSLLPTFLQEIELDGHFTVGGDLSKYATDFGGLCHYLPGAVLHPGSVADIARTVEGVFRAGRPAGLTVAPQGRGHSVRGQGQTPGGIVVRMQELPKPMAVHAGDGEGEEPYVEVSGGALWIDVLKEGLKHGLAPKSWTAYLHVTVAGSLAYAGVGGQTFRHGPQISNVRELEIVTGKGEVLNCSPELNSDLFYAALGGLGQFGIITSVTIPLEPAPKMVKWIRLLYTDVADYAADAESIISPPDDGSATFDFQEGFVNINKVGLLKYWMTSFPFVPKDPAGAEQFVSDDKVLYCIEVAKYFDPENIDSINEEVEALLSKLRYIPCTRLETELPYTVFLERVHTAELKLRAMNIWDIPHSWLNLLVPRSGIQAFGNGVFGKIVTHTNDGTLTVYPLNKSKWDDRTSAVFPDEDVFYLVGLLSGALDDESLKIAMERNARIMEFCEKEGIGMKAYIPQYMNQEEWKAHFGAKWEKFERRKREYDPLAILAPGQRIFNRI